MIPIVTPAEMAAIDAAARAGRCARRTCWRSGGSRRRRPSGRDVWTAGGGRRRQGQQRGRRRAAATRLQRRGVRCVVLDPDIAALPVEVDLVIDAAYGTGLSRPYDFPAVPEGVPVLAVDIPSGVDGLTGRASVRRPLPIARSLCGAEARSSSRTRAGTVRRGGGRRHRPRHGRRHD